ncbi:MAG: helix-turn-helix domain-containing protein, partial [Clostridia bacterium]|nr:helix-turn-helix domain-containing protein [Clostridia bacterium]
YSEFAYARRAIALGVFRYMLKPLDIKEFLAVIGDALEAIQAQNATTPGENTLETTIQSIIKARPDAARAQAAQNHLSSHGLPIGEQPVCPILIINHPVSLNKLTQALTECFLGKHALIPLNDNQTLALLTINPLRHTPKDLRHTCAMLQKSIEQPIQIIIGHPVTTAAALHDAYAEVTSLTEKLFFYPENAILAVGEPLPLPSLPETSPISALFAPQSGETAIPSIAYAKYLYSEETVSKLREAGLPPLAQAGAVELLNSAKTLQELEQKAIEITQNTARSPAPGRLVDEIRKIVGQNYMNRITVESLAAQVFRSPTYLSRVFKKAVGESLSRYINRVRMENAAALLQNNAMTVAEAARRCGFADYSYFGTLFREYYGVSPRRYQKDNADE